MVRYDEIACEPLTMVAFSHKSLKFLFFNKYYFDKHMTIVSSIFSILKITFQ